MKKYPHKPSRKLLEEYRQRERRRYPASVAGIAEAIASRNEAWFFGTWQEGRSLALYEYALDGPIGETKRFLSEGCGHIEKVIEFGYRLNAAYFQIFLQQAIVCRHTALQNRLTVMKRSDYTDPTMTVSEGGYLYAELLADITAGRIPAVEARLPAALDATKPEEHLGAQVRAVQAILAKDPQRFDAAMEADLKQHAKGYSKSAVREYPDGLIAMGGLAMLQLARKVGLKSSVESVYLPRELLDD